MSDLIKKLEAFRANLVGEDMNYRACLVDEAISRIREVEAALRNIKSNNRATLGEEIDAVLNPAPKEPV